MRRMNRRDALRGIAASALSVPFAQRLGAAEPLPIGFVYVGQIGDQGWTFAHERGRLALVEALGGSVATRFVENVPEGPDAERVIRQLAQDGLKLIFTASFGYMNPTIKVAREFPDVIFEHATGYQRAHNVGTYNIRFYQGRAVCGTIAGLLSKTGTAGYIASFPIPQVVMDFNAFTLAAQKVNPDFGINVVWTSSWYDPPREAAASHALIDQGADIISHHTDSAAPLQVCEERGRHGFGQCSDMRVFAPNAHLTAISHQWDRHYIQTARAVQSGRWESGDIWGGFPGGFLEMSPYNDAVLTPDMIEAAEAVRLGIARGSYDPFEGPIYDNEGTLRVAKGETLDDEAIKRMDWYVRGVRA